jgi:hypothetical protein
MIPKNPKPPLSDKERIEKIIKLKPAFDKLTDYNAKLDFWYKNEFDINIRTYGITDERGKKDLPENNITIYPDNNEEIKAYKKFYYKVFHKDNFRTVENSIADYWLHIKEKGADPTPYTKKQIADIDAYYEKNKKHFPTGLNALRSYASGFEASQYGKIEDFLNTNYFRESLNSYFIGEVDEKFRRFLVKQLQILESGLDNVPPQQPKIINDNVKCNNEKNCNQHFITEITDLCDACSIHEKVKSVRGNMISKYEFLAKNNTRDFLNDYLKDKIKIANEKIEKMFNTENTNGNLHRSGRVSILLSYKDCLKYYNEQFKLLNGEKIQLPNNDEYDMFFELTGLNRDSALKQTFIKTEMLNPPDIETPVLYHIPDVLRRRNITPKYAANLLDRLKSCQKKSIVENIVTPIINYLRNNETELNEVTKTTNKADEVKQLITSALENPYPLIFKNGYAYQMFLELKELTVKTRTVVADYSFIFHKMKGKHLKAINAVITEPTFIEFLNKHFQTNISVIKLPMRNPDNKQQTYSAVLTKYKEGILN